MLRIIAQIIQCNTFFAIVPHYPYGPASRKMDGTAWQYLSIKKDSPCVTIFFVYEMSPLQESFSGDAENDKARFLAICCSFSKPCCLPLPDFANLRELFLALARLCCLSRLLPAFSHLSKWFGSEKGIFSESGYCSVSFLSFPTLSWKLLISLHFTKGNYDRGLFSQSFTLKRWLGKGGEVLRSWSSARSCRASLPSAPGTCHLGKPNVSGARCLNTQRFSTT